jgi:CspA family cold shock protein
MSSSERAGADGVGRGAGDRVEKSGGPEKGAASRGGVTARLEAIEGKVKWFDPRKGFGFIVGPEGQDIFVHYSIIQGDGFRVLKDGSTVQYDAERSDKGWKATACKRVEQIEVQGEKKTGYTRSPRR